MGRDRFQQRRSALGYQAPAEREGCRSCRHRSAEALSFDGGRIAYDCRLGGFLVVPGGICREYQQAGIAARPVKGA